MKIISLGWGVQSWGLAAMVALGKLPPVDAAVHADTTHERRETYEFAAQWTPWLEERGVRVVTVSDKKAANALYGKTGQTHLPCFTLPVEGNRQVGIYGQLRRSCTQRWKIAPQRRFISAELASRGLAKTPEVVEQWFGITLDEWERMRTSDVKYVRNAYPLFDLNMSRGDVMRWLDQNNLPIPVKSSCVFCPYHDLATWREIKLSGNGDWQKAVDVDHAIRDKRPGYKCYLHPKRIPLDEVDVRNEQDHGQLELWDYEECTGNCFI